MTESDDKIPTKHSTPRRRDWRPKLRWFAAEIIVVVVGILIALAINASWQSRQDRISEQAYLRQLSGDCQRTVDLMTWAGDELRPADRANKLLAQAYFLAQPPPTDSVLLWLDQARGQFAAHPEVGTIKALIATGDIALIRDDSLREALVDYLGFAEAMTRLLTELDASWEQNFNRVGRLSIWGSSRMNDLDPAVVDSIARADPYSPVPAGPRRSVPSLDIEALVRDAAFYNAVYEMNTAKARMSDVRRWITGNSIRIKQQIDAERNR